MTSYYVHVVCKHNTRQLLLIQGLGDTPISLAVYDEHTGTTLMRMTEPTLAEFTRAIAILSAE
jgi:hypothetical protein